MLRKDIYNNIVEEYNRAYSWLGEDFAKEFLNSVASWNIQTYNIAPFRIRRHLMLCWQHSMLKSTLLISAYKILGKEACTHMSDLSNAALRGTVDYGRFVSPYTLKRPFAVCTEFGQLSGSGDKSELVQKLLNVLEEGFVEVSLGKIASLSDATRDQISEDWGIYFIDKNTFSYKTNWVLMAATYNKKFLVDNALESRFVILHPRKPFDNALTKHVVNAGGLRVDEETKIALRAELQKNKEIETNIKLPEGIFEGGPITPRDCASLLSTILCRGWWNISTSKDEIIQMADKMRKSREEIWKTAEDKVYDAILDEPKTAKQIAEETKYSVKHVHHCLNKMRNTVHRDITYDEDGKRRIVYTL